MATQINIFKRLFTKPAKKNPDWARVEEPDTIVKPVTYAVFGIMITAFLVMLAYSVMIGSPAEKIARFLLSFGNDFQAVYASFGVALIILINLVVTVMFTFFSTADNDDLVEMLSDLDANIQERIVELENTFTQEINDLHKELDDLVVTK